MPLQTPCHLIHGGLLRSASLAKNALAKLGISTCCPRQMSLGRGRHQAISFGATPAPGRIWVAGLGQLHPAARRLFEQNQLRRSSTDPLVRSCALDGQIVAVLKRHLAMSTARRLVRKRHFRRGRAVHGALTFRVAHRQQLSAADRHVCEREPTVYFDRHDKCENETRARMSRPSHFAGI